METVYDGYISKYVNRKASEPMARLLARTKITLNQVTWAAFGIAILSFISFIFGQNIIGCILMGLGFGMIIYDLLFVGIKHMSHSIPIYLVLGAIGLVGAWIWWRNR